VVLLVESLRPDVLRTTGGAYDVMPALDSLARDSRRYTHAYAESSHSDYADVCPMSSHYPLRSREHHYYPEHPVYPRVLVYDVLKALGYRTAIVSSQNEQWGGMYNYLDTGSLDLFFHAETFHSTVIDPEDTVFSKWAKDYGHSGKVDDRNTIDEAIRFIGQSEKPFFMYLNLQNSHFPYRTPDDFPKRFSPHVIDFPYTFGKFPIEKLEVVKNRYRNSLSYMDAQIGRLIEFLRKTRRLDRTVLVVTGDNGEAFYEHGGAAHAGPLFEEAVRVPLIVHAPGVSPGDDSRLAQHIDIPPTVLGLLGIPQHPSFQGIDLVHAPEDRLRSAYLLVQTAITSQIALVRDGWKLVADFTYRRYYLYDLVHDPGEKKDLADADPARVAAMAGRLHAFQKAQLDYYADEGRMRSTYPPVLSDRDP
jgi:arylsulfatase A-like enzyme